MILDYSNVLRVKIFHSGGSTGHQNSTVRATVHFGHSCSICPVHHLVWDPDAHTFIRGHLNTTSSSYSCPSLFWYCPQWVGPLTSTINQENALQAYQWANLMNVFSELWFPVLWWLQLVSNKKINQARSNYKKHYHANFLFLFLS